MNTKGVKHLFKIILPGGVRCCSSPALFAASGPDLVVDNLFLKDKINTTIKTVQELKEKM